MDPVNKLYLFDWMILINTEYVVYSMCVGVGVCVLTFMLIEYIYIYIYNILLYITYHFLNIFLLISRITIVHITIYIVLIVFLFYNPFAFSRILKKNIIFPSSLHL